VFEFQIARNGRKEHSSLSLFDKNFISFTFFSPKVNDHLPARFARIYPLNKMARLAEKYDNDNLIMSYTFVEIRATSVYRKTLANVYSVLLFLVAYVKLREHT